MRYCHSALLEGKGCSGREIEEFQELNYREPGKLTSNEYNSYQTLNALIEDEVEVR